MVDAPLELPLAPLLAALSEPPRRAMDRLAEHRFRFVQLSASQPGMRPRELDQSGRRDLVASLRRREIEIAGLELWIPVEHFTDVSHADRAVSAAAAAIEMAADLGRCPVSLHLPRDDDNVLGSISAASQRHGVPIADHALPLGDYAAEGLLGVGIDPAALLANADDPAQAVALHAHHLVSARIADINSAAMRCAPGKAGGRLDATAYRVALSVADYQRPVVIDSRQWAEPWTQTLHAAEVWAASSSPR